MRSLVILCFLMSRALIAAEGLESTKPTKFTEQGSASPRPIECSRRCSQLKQEERNKLVVALEHKSSEEWYRIHNPLKNIDDVFPTWEED